MLGHLKICAGPTGSNSWQNCINVTVCEPSTGPMKKGINEVAALVYGNQLSAMQSQRPESYGIGTKERILALLIEAQLMKNWNVSTVYWSTKSEPCCPRENREI